MIDKLLTQEVAPQLKEIEQLEAAHVQRLQARENATQALREAEAAIAPLVAQRESLRAEYQDATFEEDAARVREISNQRKGLDKQISVAQKAVEKAKKAHEKADFDSEAAGAELGYEVAKITHEVNETLRAEQDELQRISNETRAALQQHQTSTDRYAGGHEGRMQHGSEIVKAARENDLIYQESQPGFLRKHVEKLQKIEAKRHKEYRKQAGHYEFNDEVA